MPFRPFDRIKFEIERRILRSPLDRLFVIAVAIVVISAARRLAGVAVHSRVRSH